MDNSTASSGCGIMLLGIIMFFILVSSNAVVAVLFGMAGVIGGGIYALYYQEKKEKENIEKREMELKIEQDAKDLVCPKLESKIKDIHMKFEDTYKKPTNSLKVHIIGYSSVNCWTDTEQLCLLSDWSDIIDKFNSTHSKEMRDDYDKNVIEPYLFAMVIPISQICFYRIEGDMYTETNVTGGGGGGSSISGAIVGGVIAGNTGAVIGSRKKNDPISSNTIVHDSRTLVLYYYKNRDDLQMQTLKMTIDSYSSLLSIIPNKEHAYVVGKGTDLEKANNSDIINKLKTLKELREQNLITDNEYNTKKDEILNIL